jgi:serine/threonine protein kinase
MSGTTRIGDYDVRQTSVVAGMVRYEATHIVLPRRAVIEILDPATPRTFAVRMLRHACILEALHHPGIPRVFECGMLDGRPWVAYERTEGPTLEAELGSRRLHLSEVLDLIEQVAAILTHAHARGVLHRDITPDAIIRDIRRGDTLLLDHWANACTLDTELASPLKGNNRYRAPELIHDRPTDGRADVYALGMIVYQALIGDPGWQANDLRTHPATLRTLIAAMINDEAMLRPTAAEVLVTVRAIREQIAQQQKAEAADSEYASVEVAYTELPAAREEDSVEVALDELMIEPPRAKARWTPQWSLEDQAAVARGVVEIPPRRRRNVRPDTE